jgi:hypothetical protein
MVEVHSDAVYVGNFLLDFYTPISVTRWNIKSTEFYYPNTFLLNVIAIILLCFMFTHKAFVCLPAIHMGSAYYQGTMQTWTS